MRSKFPAVEFVTRPFYELMLEKVLQNHRRSPTQLAVISATDPTHKISWLELYNTSHYLASFLSRHAFSHGQTCSIILPNCWQLPVAFFGATLAGGAVVFSNIIYTEYEIGKHYAEARPTVVITDSARLSKVLAAVSSTKTVKTIICVNNSSDDLHSSVFSFDETIQETTPLFQPDSAKFSPDDVLLLPFSSGSTGPSKGVLLTHKSFGTSTAIFQKAFAQRVYAKIVDSFDPEQEYNLIIRPTTHMYGFLLLMHGIFDGLTSVLINDLEMRTLCQTIQDFKIKILYLVPTNIRALTLDPETENFDLTSVRFVLTSGEACTDEVANSFLDRHPNVRFLAQGYGMSETGGFINFPLLEHRKDMSSGLIGPNVEEKIVDLRTRAEARPGESGEVYIRGAMMKGYLNRPQSDAFDDDGWFRSGDVGYFDEKGRLIIVDRVKHMIKVRGMTVVPADLENTLLCHPKVKEAVVIGVRDAEAGERPKAFIIKKDDSLTADEIHEFMKRRVAAYRQLTGGVEFKTHFPRTDSGKVLRRSLVET